MPSLAEIWMERGEKRGEKRGIIKGEKRGIVKGEKIGIIKGETIAILDSIKRGLELKFNQFGKSIFLSIQKIQEIDKLKEIQDALLLIHDADEFNRFVQKRAVKGSVSQK